MRFPLHLALALAISAAACAADAPPLPYRASVLDAMRRAANFQIQDFAAQTAANPGKPVPDSWWKSGVYFLGLSKALPDLKDPALGDYLVAWARDPKLRRLEKGAWHADALTALGGYLAAEKMTGDPAILAGIPGGLLPMVESSSIPVNRVYPANMPNRPDAASIPMRGRDLWWWCDALMMAPPQLIELSNRTGDPRFREFTHKIYWDSAEFLYDKDEALFYRDKNFVPGGKAHKSPGGKKNFWSRGNGWVFSGLAQILEVLPKDDPCRARYETLFREMAASIVKYQQPDGLWRAALIEPERFPEAETSGTGLFCHGLLWGINNGILPRDQYLAPALKAWSGLASRQAPGGAILSAQGPAASPGKVDPNNAMDYGAGIFLLCGHELLKLLPEGS